jgi:protein-S-isoprenylcysteine O-methyltransferase Ste14
MNSNLIEYRPPRIAMALLAIAIVLDRLMPIALPTLFSSVYLSTVLVSAGFSIMMMAWWQFRQRQVAICPTAITDSLITDGIYRLTGNPMYLGIVLMLCGVAVFVGTLPFYAVAVLYFVLINHWFCPYEEEKLLVTFGRNYESYRSSVRRWI